MMRRTRPAPPRQAPLWPAPGHERSNCGFTCTHLRSEGVSVLPASNVGTTGSKALSTCFPAGISALSGFFSIIAVVFLCGLADTGITGCFRPGRQTFSHRSLVHRDNASTSELCSQIVHPKAGLSPEQFPLRPCDSQKPYDFQTEYARNISAAPLVAISDTALNVKADFQKSGRFLFF